MSHSKSNTCNKSSSFISFINSDNYQVYNRIVAKKLGSVNAAIMLSELIGRFQYHEKNDELISNEKYGSGWFYFTEEKCQDRTCLSRKEQDSAIKLLIDFGFIEKVIFGLPATRHFRIKDEEIFACFIDSKKDSSLSKKDKLDCPKGTNYIDRKGQTAHIYKEPQEEPNEEPQQLQRRDGVDVVENFDEIKDINQLRLEKAQALELYFLDFSKKDGDGYKRGSDWALSAHVFMHLFKTHSIPYVIAQVNAMTRKHETAEKQSLKPHIKRKMDFVWNPVSYITMSCVNNYAGANK